MVAPIENYTDINGLIAAIGPHATLADFLVVDIEVENAEPVPAVGPVPPEGPAPAVEPQVGGAPATFYPNWFEGAPGTTVSAAIRRDAPGADQLAVGRRLRGRIRGAGPGGTFIQPDSLLVE
jgi:hypothetical protein